MNSAASPEFPFAARRRELGRTLAAQGLDALLVTDLTNIRYLTGFTGSNAALLVPADDPDSAVLCTDFRYLEQVREESPDVQATIDRPVDEALVRETSYQRIGFEEHIVTVARSRALSGALPTGAEWVGVTGVVEDLRAVKDSHEVRALQAACEIADAALDAMLEHGRIRVGRTEREVALDLDERMRRLGSRDIAFPTILATGPNSSIPHHQPTDRELQTGDLVKIDFGAVVAGYHSDMTRTFVLGEPADWQRDVHALVLRAQQAGCDAVAPGVDVADVDAAARDVIVSAGHGDHFGHGLGHGVGLQIHEAPWFAATGTGAISADMTVTVEPGVYLPGRGGVRIEDCGVVTAAGFVPLSLSPLDLLVL